MSALARRHQAYAGLRRVVEARIKPCPSCSRIEASSYSTAPIPHATATSSKVRLDAIQPGAMHSVLSPNFTASGTSRNEGPDSILSRLETTLLNEEDPHAHSQEWYDGMTKKLMKQGLVLKAMRLFYIQAIRARETICVESFDSFFTELSRCVRKPPKRSDDPNVRFSKYTTWIPSQLPPGADARSLPLALQCTYVAATLFDLLLELKITRTPSEASLASTLYIFSKTLSKDVYMRAVNVALLCHGGRTLAEAQMIAAEEKSSKTIRFDLLQAENIPKSVVNTIVVGLGRLREPKLGEQLLCWTEAAASLNETRTAATWNALIRSRCLMEDQRGALRHLRDFRKALREGRVQLQPYPKKPYGPYFTYLKAVTSLQPPGVGGRKYLRTSTRSPQTRSEAVWSVVRWLREDDLGLEPRIVSLLLNFEVGHGRIEGAAGMVWDMLGDGSTNSLFQRDVHSLSGLFRMYRLHDGHAPFQALLHSSSQTTPNQAQMDLTTLRRLYQCALPIVRDEKEGAEPTLKLLNEALDAALVMGDLPLALVTLRSMGFWHLLPDGRTWRAIANWFRTTVFPSQVQDDASLAQDASCSEQELNLIQGNNGQRLNEEELREKTNALLIRRAEQRGGVVRYGDATYVINTSGDALPASNLRYLIGLVEGQIEKAVNDARRRDCAHSSDKSDEAWIVDAIKELEESSAEKPFSKDAILQVVMAKVNAEVLPRRMEE